MMIFARRDGGLLKAVDQDAIWVGPAIERLGGPNRAPSDESIENLQFALASLAFSLEPPIAANALTRLGDFHRLPAEIRASVRQVAVDESQQFSRRMAALAVLMRQPSADEAAIAAGMLLRDGSRLGENGPDVSMVGALLANVDDSSAFDSLAQIADSALAPERWWRSALETLRESRNPRAIPVFIKALDSPDVHSQHVSVLALAEITGKGGREYGPGYGLFLKEPQFSIQNWKIWWQEDGRRYY